MPRRTTWSGVHAARSAPAKRIAPFAIASEKSANSASIAFLIAFGSVGFSQRASGAVRIRLTA